jgi:hypothetical protein
VDFCWYSLNNPHRHSRILYLLVCVPRIVCIMSGPAILIHNNRILSDVEVRCRRSGGINEPLKRSRSPTDMYPPSRERNVRNAFGKLPEKFKHPPFETVRPPWGRLPTHTCTHPAKLWFERTRQNFVQTRSRRERKRFGFLWGRNPTRR